MPRAVAAQPSPSAVVVISNGAPASCQHECQPLGRVARVERQIGAPRLENAEEPHQQLERALDAKPNHRLRPDPLRAQMMRQLVGPRLQLPVAQARVLANTTAIASGRAAACAANSSGSVAGKTARPVAFHSSSSRAAQPQTTAQAAQSQHPAPLPPPPEHEPDDPPAPRRCRDRTGRSRIQSPR